MDESNGIHSFRLHNTGLARVFGELEAEIMDTIWGLGTASVQDVCDTLGDGYNYKTVTTVMNRLCKKGVLDRQLLSRAFFYQPTQTRDEFEKTVAHSVVSGLFRDFGNSALAQFIDVIDEVEPDQLQRLQELIEAKKKGLS